MAQETEPLNQETDPFVSIVIPMRNEKQYIEDCLNSFFAQSYPLEKIELIVVDGDSDDGSRDIVEELAKSFSVKLLSNPGGYTPVGMNLGLKEAKGEIAIIFSAHAEAAPDFVRKNVDVLQKTKAAVAGGRLINRSQGEFARLAGKVLSHPFGVGNSKFRYSAQPGYVDTVAYGAYRMDVLQQSGLFDERLIRNQDIELNYRIRRQGFKIYFDPEIIAYYVPRENYERFVKQAYGNGFWNIITARLCASSLSWRHFVPLAFVLALIGALGLSLGFHPIFLGLVLIPYLALDVVFSFKLAAGVFEFLQLLVLFPSLHISYGLGSLTALLKQIFSWRDYK